MNITKLAWKNVWRNRRRSIVTMAAMSIALTALLVFASLQSGLTTGLERSVVELENGDVEIFAPGYRDKPSLFDRIADPNALIQKLEADGFKASARVKANGLAAGEKASAGAMLVGVDTTHDVSKIGEQIGNGAWLAPDAPKEVVIGGRLAKTLHLGVGEEILLVGSAADGSMANALYRVRGVLQGAGDAADRSGVYLNMQTLRDLMVLPDGAQQIIVRRPAKMSLEEAYKRVRELAPNLDVQTWKMLLPTVAQMLENQKASRVVISLILFTAVGIVILNAMLMAVFERIHELGVLKAIGMQPLTIFALILAEALVQTLLAMVAGILLAAGPLYFMVTRGIDLRALAGVSVQGVAYGTHWLGELDAQSLITPIVTLFVMSFAAALFPALKAARLQPVEAMHHL